ncbi:alpha/beta hydrolase [Nibribacter ruber]|uniref:Alpha/beta hydrolase n=1 Tax=Nibribacter ruber TaxID=2698458 RepID=A0A6P1NUE0_9BACT|nr:alpha/beta hydrolase-fold protein [Nibribacter ruber]QHL86660.1 alpha/beta hydrolase [Nibribacter ruber]
MKNSFSAKLMTLLLVGVGVHSASAQVTFEVTKVPAKTPAQDTLFLAGNHNNWNPGSKTHAFKKNANGRWYLTMPSGPGELEYKITRGNWATGEALISGAPKNNRIYVAKKSTDTVRVEIESWSDFFASPEKVHTASPNVKILSNEFWMPQLNRSRRVWIYLPPDYATSGKRYPVLYMHDGQNLFDAFYGYSGEWGVDESMDKLFAETGRGAIIVAPDNGSDQRMNEYTPWKNAQYGGGQGDAYVDFLAQTLKPYMDAHYRTLADKKHTGVAGSSMGGLISLYAALKHPSVFGKAGVFSPAFWVSPEVYSFVETHKVPKDLKIVLLAGEKEGQQMVPDMARMRDLLLKKGLKKKNLHYETHADGEHKESFWQREFPDAFTWLFYKK